jgi:hypothetical protein
LMLAWRESNITPSQSKMTAENEFTECLPKEPKRIEVGGLRKNG